MDLTSFLYALLSGIIPAILWLWFWLREDNLHPEPRSLLTRTFIAGMGAVILVIPFQMVIDHQTMSVFEKYTLWAFFEEALKLGAAFIIALRSRHMDEPIDAIIYMITVALGFAALENTFFILGPLLDGDITQGIINGNLRFVGATLVHVVCSATIGFFVALTFSRSRPLRFASTFVGLITATALHATFNLFIINAKPLDTLKIFGIVWIGVIVLIFLFEKVKIMSSSYNPQPSHD